MKTDYLAIVNFGCVGGSFGRDDSIFEAVQGAIRLAILDWSRYYQLEGSSLNVELFEVTGHEDITWTGGTGYVEADNEVKIDRLKVIKVELPELTGRMKITGPKYQWQTTQAVAKACSEVAA